MDNNNLFTTKAEYVYKLMKDKILKSQWNMGDSIIISKVAEELDVSIIPIREALKRLETEGLVDIIPHKGARVTTIDSDKVAEIISIRAVLEGYAARTIIPYMDEERLKHLKSMVAKMDQYVIEGNTEQFAVSNKEFHREMYRLTPYPLLYDMIFNLWDGGNWSKSVFAFEPARMAQSNEEHKKILATIEEKDGNLVERLVRDHKNNNIKTLQKKAFHYFNGTTGNA